MALSQHERKLQSDRTVHLSLWSCCGYSWTLRRSQPLNHLILHTVHLYTVHNTSGYIFVHIRSLPLPLLLFFSCSLFSLLLSLLCSHMLPVMTTRMTFPVHSCLLYLSSL